jgi:hypothetical protein
LISTFVPFTSAFATLASTFAGLTALPTDAFVWAPVVFTVEPFALEPLAAELLPVAAFTVALFAEAFAIEAFAAEP